MGDQEKANQMRMLYLGAAKATTRAFNYDTQAKDFRLQYWTDGPGWTSDRAVSECFCDAVRHHDAAIWKTTLELLRKRALRECSDAVADCIKTMDFVGAKVSVEFPSLVDPATKKESV